MVLKNVVKRLKNNYSLSIFVYFGYYLQFCNQNSKGYEQKIWYFIFCAFDMWNNV